MGTGATLSPPAPVPGTRETGRGDGRPRHLHQLSHCTTGAVERGERYNPATGTLSYGSRGTATGPGGSSVSRDSAAAENRYGQSAAVHQTTFDNARTGESHTVTTARVGDNVYAGADGHVYRNTGGGWRVAAGETSWADRDQAAGPRATIASTPSHTAAGATASATVPAEAASAVAGLVEAISGIALEAVASAVFAGAVSVGSGFQRKGSAKGALGLPMSITADCRSRSGASGSLNSWNGLALEPIGLGWLRLDVELEGLRLLVGGRSVQPRDAKWHWIGLRAKEPRSPSHTHCILPVVIFIAFFLVAHVDSPRRGMIRGSPQDLLLLATSIPGP
jgi:hypothetical protein